MSPRGHGLTPTQKQRRVCDQDTELRCDRDPPQRNSTGEVMVEADGGRLRYMNVMKLWWVRKLSDMETEGVEPMWEGSVCMVLQLEINQSQLDPMTSHRLI